MTILALDVGGANLKAADGLGWARSVPFALWNGPDQLASTLADLVVSAPKCTRIAVTMTGELCDCFPTKSDGVNHILAAVEAAAGERDVCVYLVNGRMVTIAEARELVSQVSASNWHALAQYACRMVGEEPSLLVDVGSTTTDIIPLVAGRVAARGFTDTERLLSGELVYTGVARTPVCAVARSLPYRGASCPVAAELFATTADAYVLLGDMVEQPDATWTADGRPLVRRFARERLARMICADATTFDDRDALAAAEAIRHAQIGQLRAAIDCVTATLPQPPTCVVVSGVGEFLALTLVSEEYAQARVVSLASELGADVSACAPAHALAVLTREASER